MPVNSLVQDGRVGRGGALQSAGATGGRELLDPVHLLVCTRAFGQQGLKRVQEQGRVDIARDSLESAQVLRRGRVTIRTQCEVGQ